MRRYMTIIIGSCMFANAEIGNFAQVETDRILVPEKTSVWDFREAEITRGQLKVTSINFGDSLMIERYPGLRLVFEPETEGLRLVREENPNSMLGFADSCDVGIYKDKHETQSDKYSAKGLYAARWRTQQYGEYTTSTSSPGTLISCDGDTIKGVVCQSLVRRYSATADSIKTYKGETTYHRWVRGDEQLPYAFMAVSRICDDKGGVVSASDVTYIRRLNAGEEQCIQDQTEGVSLPSPDDLTEWLSQMSAAVGTGTIKVNLPGCEGTCIDPLLPVYVTVTDERGVLYASAQGVCGDSSITVACANLYPGHYIVAVTVPGTISSTTAKRLLTIY